MIGRALIVLALILVIHTLGILHPLHRQIVDWRFSLGDRPASETLVVVEIDAKSLRELDTWPWPRGYHARLVERLFEAGAHHIAFDIDFSSRSTEAADGEFERALVAHGSRVTLPIFEQYQVGPDGPESIFSVPLERFQRHVNLASVNVVPDDDGLIWRMSPTATIGDIRLPSLSTALTGRAPPSEARYLMDFGIDVFGIPRVSYADVLSGDFDPSIVRGKMVLIGATAIELNDILSVPRHVTMPGVLLHALAYESLVQGRTIASAPEWAVMALAVLVIALLVWPLSALPWRGALALWAATAVLLFVVAAAVQISTGVDLQESAAIVASFAMFLLGVLGRVDLQAVIMRRQKVQFDRVDAIMNRIVETSLDGILTFGDDGRVQTANAAALKLLAGPAEAVIGAPAEIFLSDAGLATTVHGGAGRQIEATIRALDGSEVPVEFSVARVEDEEQAVNVAVFSDITERKRHEAELQRMAHFDELTGLANRILLRERLNRTAEEAAGEGISFAVLLLDLDRFKEINDTLGHSVGDMLLKSVAERVLEVCAEDDTLARLGGDEFVLVLRPGSDKARAQRVSSSIIAALTRPFDIKNMNFEIGVSIGVATYPDHAEDPDDLVKCADVAMYLAKKSLDHIAFYDREKDQHSVRNLALTGELRHAIENEQLVFAYQPKLDLETGEIYAFEALVRWIHPVHGFVPPDDFISHAERTGLIGPLTRWGLEKALSQLAAWRADGYDFAVAINLSTANLMEPDLPQTVVEIIERHGVPPARVTLEITENALMADPDQALRTICALRDIGVRLSIDDFGTGYSSLGYPKSLPVHELKIDKSFVMPMTEDEADRVIVRSTIDLAHNLGLKVVAEGVEEAAHIEALRALRCDTAQGYFIAKPLSPADLASWLTEGKWAARRLAALKAA